MLANVFTKTIRDRWRGWAIAVAAVGSLVVMGMSVYRGIDLSVIASLPEAYLSLIGIRGGMDVGALAVGAIYGSYGSMTFAAMALVMGAASIAGEERKGTIGLLLANPKSRTHVLLSKTASLVVLSAAAAVLMWGVVYFSAQTLDISLGELDLVALNVHMFANALFYGLLATAIGAATGNRGVAVGASAGVLVVGFLGTGLMPLIEGGEKWAKVFPWYYFNGSEPLYNGIDWGHVAVLTGASVLLGVVAVAGLARRDLKSQSVGTTMLDRLRAAPATKKLADRLAGSARVSSIWLKTASEYQTLLLACAAYMFLLQGFMMGPFYSAIPKETLDFAASLPKNMIVLFGGGDMSTPQGWYQLETFGMMAPIIVMVVTIAIGAGAIAGEEAKRTMGLLLANPVSRSRVLAEKAWAMVLYGSLVGVATFAGVWLGSVVGDLGMDVGNIAATCLLLTLVGLAGGALALALGAGTGRKGVAVYGAVGAALGLHLLNSLGEMNGDISGLQKLSPFYYYLSSDPLNNGMDWGHAAVLAAICVLLVASSFWLFQRRDIREGE